MPSLPSHDSRKHFPPLQTSFTVQKLPSLHGPVALLRVQAPVAGSQASMVQELPSSHETGECAHSPVAGSHVSRVQRSPSSQFFATPWQTTPPEGVATQTSL